MPQIETVSGPIDDGELGLFLAHEHLTLVTEQVHAQFPHLYDDEAIYEAAVEQVQNAMEQGVKTIVEPSCMDIGRDVHLAQRVAEATGIQLVMCTGVYGQHYTFLPQYFENRDPQALVDAFLHDIETGIQGTDVKAAFLKCAVDEPGVTDDVERVLRAAARGQPEDRSADHGPLAARDPARPGDHGRVRRRGHRPAQGADRPHRRHGRPRLHRGAAGARPVDRDGPLWPGHLPADGQAQRDRDRAVQARLREPDDPVAGRVRDDGLVPDRSSSRSSRRSGTSPSCGGECFLRCPTAASATTKSTR